MEKMSLLKLMYAQIMAYSRKDALQRLKHKNKRK